MIIFNDDCKQQTVVKPKEEEKRLLIQTKHTYLRMILISYQHISLINYL